tara:strand:+ start:113 stop:1720 length:1608 start_codon:yes stop_codon:yes gene_type:complete
VLVVTVLVIFAIGLYALPDIFADEEGLWGDDFTNPIRTSFETYSNEKYGFTINIPSTWETEELDLFDGEVTNVVNFYSPEGDVITILKEYELWSAPINPSTIKQTANMFLLGIKEECNNMTIARDGITCTNVELTKAQKGMVGTIDSTDIFYTIDYEDYEYYYPKTALAKIWNDPADNTAWFVMGFTNDESSEYTNFFKSIDSLKISKSTTQPVIRTTNYVNEQYGFSVTPPSGWDTQIFEDIYIDSKSQPGEQFRALATYQMLNSNAQYVVPTMGIMVMEIQQKIDWSTDPDGSAFAEGLLYGIESTGSTGNLLSSNLEKIPNGFHASFTADLGMNVGLQTLIPTKAAGEAWIFDDGLLVMYVYQAERSEYNKFLQDYKNSVNTFFFKPRAIEQSTQPTQTSSSEGGGCLIATAAFGSEMAPQVQFLREIRDNTVMSTQSGTAFMTGFNQFYYSFSPYVADYERENPVFKEAVKVTLTPLLTSLTLLNYVEIDSEEEMLGYGIGIILLNVGIYFVMPAVLIISIKKRFFKKITN